MLLKLATCFLFVLLSLQLPTHARASDRCITIATFNVQNLFQADTSEKKRSFQTKIENLRDALVANSPNPPDILFLQEISNEESLREFLRYAYPNTDYSIVVGKTEDANPLFPAIATQLPVLTKPQIRRLNYPINPLERGIVSVEIALDKIHTATVASLHLPSPKISIRYREQYFSKLTAHLADRAQSGTVIIGGDMNLPAHDLTQMNSSLDILKRSFHIAHLNISEHNKIPGVPGTYFFSPANRWEFLDWLLISHDLLSSESIWQFDVEQTRIGTKGKEQLNEERYPKRFHYKTQSGTSDHLPLFGAICNKEGAS